MCKSVRGAAYFGSSLHLAFSFVFLFWFVFDTLISEININLWKCDPPEQKFSDLNPLAHYLNLLFKLLYFTGLCITGVYTFRGVERERPQLLKFATLAFVILQIVGVILFSIFFSIQWNAEPADDTSLSGIQAARLVGEEAPPLPEVPAPPPACVTQCVLSGITTQNVPNNNDNAAKDDPMGEPDLKAVTPLASENVLEAPDISNTTSTTTTPMPPPPPVEIIASTVTTQPPVNLTTTNTAATTPVPAVPVVPTPCTTPECLQTLSPGKPQARKLPHNQLVRLVLQMCFAITNGLVSVAYVIVLALYMLKL